MKYVLIRHYGECIALHYIIRVIIFNVANIISIKISVQKEVLDVYKRQHLKYKQDVTSFIIL